MSPPPVLIAAATRHGCTTEIAGAIRNQLSQAGFDVDVAVPRLLTSLERYDAVLLGSPLYGGRWLPAARKFAQLHSEKLQTLPVWLFSVGISPEPPKGECSTDVARMRDLTGASEHELFAGKLDRSALRIPERALVRAVGAMDGDYRDWAAVSAWTEDVVEAIPH